MPVALEGNLSDFSVDEMLRLLAGGGKTGVLVATGASAVVHVCFLEGKVTFASLGEQDETLSRQLAADGVVTPKQLRQALGLQKIQRKDRAGRTLGAILVDEGYVDADTVERFVLDQVAEVLFEVGRWESGELRFEPDETCTADDLGYPVSVTDLLNEAERRREVWERIREQIPDVDARFAIAEQPGERTSEIRVSPRQWAVLCHLHGGRTLREVMQRTGLEEFDAAEAVSTLLTSGLVVRVDDAGMPVGDDAA